MKVFIKNIWSELRWLACSPAGCIFLVLQSAILGFAFHDTLAGYSGLSIPLENSMTGAATLEPLRDFLSPVFRLSYLYPSICLPILFSGIIPGSPAVKFNFIGRFFGVGRTLYGKIIAGFLFYLVILALSLPGLYYWVMVGGKIYYAEAALLYGGYALYGLCVLTGTVFIASVLRNRTAATAAAMVCIGALFGHEWCSALWPAHCPPGTVTVLSVMDYFESGSLFVPAMAFMAAAALLLVALTNAMLMVRCRKKTILLIVFMAVGLGAAMAGAAAMDQNMFGEAVALAEHEDYRASSWAVLNAEGQIGPYIGYPGATANYGTMMPEAEGHPLVLSDGNQKDLRAVYWGVIPLIMILIMAVKAIEKSGISRTTKRVVMAPATWLAVMISLALVQDFYIKNNDWRIFPSLRDILPRWAVAAGEQFFPGAGPAAEKKPAGTGTGSLPAAGDPNFIYAGKEYHNLQRFFKKLSDLQAQRRNTVHIVHYGDSLIWGDCYSKTVKKRFQAEFGDGGRGIVPPVETMATALKDHVNRTSSAGFSQHAIRHEFRYLGKFYVRPPVNPLIGFTGEGTFARMPGSTIRMEAPAGSAKWKKVKVFLRSPAGAPGLPSECRLTLDYGGGKEQKALTLNPGATGSLAWDIPESDRIVIDFNGSSGALPSVDAVAVETGSGIVYSTIVRMGIHMAWMNAVPEEHLKPLAELRPDLLVFQFGINEAASLGAFPEFTKEILRSQMREWLMKLKRLLPETDILLIGPPERLQAYQGGLATMEETLVVREVQREEAALAGIAYFDTYDSLGGEGHMLKMANSGLAMKDYTHFTMRGGDAAAESFYTSLMNAYRKKSEKPNLDIKMEEKSAILFNSAGFAYFLGTVVLIAFLLRKWPAVRFAFLLAASWYFYATWNLWPLACLAATTITDYSMARLIQRSRERGARGTQFLLLSLTVNLGILFTLKYFDFFSDLTGKGLNALGFQSSVPILNILLPVGISFYTFQSLSYTIDVWRGVLEPEKNLIRYGHYVSLFTQLLAGPIVKARDFLPGLRDRASHFLVTHEHFSAALFLILTGLLKKAGADWLAGSIVDRVYASPHMFLSLETLAAVYAYGIQIYGDFSGYSDMAIGSAMLLGYNLTENFRRPYQSASVSEFWQRWHISLGSWLRDYLYISLGGNRRRVMFNLFMTMFLCGLWHGAAVPFVIWGIYHGLFMIVERIFGLNRKAPANPILRGIRVFITLHLVLFGWIIFRSDSWETFTGILTSLGRFSPGAPNVGIILVLVMAAFYAIHFTPVAWKEKMKLFWGRLPATAQGLAASCVTVFIYAIATAEVKPFIYFQF